MSNELQKDDITLPGGLGFVTMASNGIPREIKQVVANNDGSVTITVGKNIYDHYSDKSLEEINEILKTEDADFEIIEPKQLKQ